MAADNRMELIAQAHKKWEREQLVAAAHAKWEAENQQADEPKTGAGEAALEHFGNAASLGYLPHMQAAAEGLMPDPSAGVDDDLRARGFKVQNAPDQNYVRRRDANIARQDLESKEHPLASGLGTAAGIAANVVGTGGLGTVAKGAGLAQRLGSAAKVGATFGALANPGDVQGEVAPFQIDERTKNAAIGGATGLAGQALAENAGPIANRVGKYFGAKAEEKAVKAAGAYQKDMVAADNRGNLNQMGRTLLDEKVVTPLATPGKISSRLEGKIGGLEDKLTGLIGDAEEKLGKTEFWDALPVDQQEKLMGSLFDPKATAERLKAEIKSKYSQIPEEKLKPALNEIDTWFSNRAQVMSPAEVQQAKVQMKRFLKDSDFVREVGIQKEGTLAARRGFKEGVEKTADTLASVMGEKGGQIKKTNQDLGNLLQAQKMADTRAAREAGNRSISLTDTIAGAAGMASGTGPVGKMALSSALAGANKLGRTFGNSIQATGFNAVSKQLLKIPKLAEMAKTNPEGFSALVSRTVDQMGGAPAQPILHPRFAEDTGRDVAGDRQDPTHKAHGGVISGQARVSGDSKKNDTVPTMLSPGEIVIPRSHANDPGKAKAFIDQLFSNKMSGGGQVPEERETLGSSIGYPGFPKPKAKTKAMAHGGFVPKPMHPEQVSDYSKKHGLPRDMAEHILSERGPGDYSPPTKQERNNFMLNSKPKKRTGK
jgi:hypothetical protein